MGKIDGAGEGNRTFLFFKGEVIPRFMLEHDGAELFNALASENPEGSEKAEDFEFGGSCWCSRRARNAPPRQGDPW